jgi:hypothetical protein
MQTGMSGKTRRYLQREKVSIASEEGRKGKKRTPCSP